MGVFMGVSKLFTALDEHQRHDSRSLLKWQSAIARPPSLGRVLCVLIAIRG